jgi:hypothetical protein
MPNRTKCIPSVWCSGTPGAAASAAAAKAASQVPWLNPSSAKTLKSIPNPFYATIMILWSGILDPRPMPVVSLHHSTQSTRASESLLDRGPHRLKTVVVCESLHTPARSLVSQCRFCGFHVDRHELVVADRCSHQMDTPFLIMLAYSRHNT